MGRRSAEVVLKEVEAGLRELADHDLTALTEGELLEVVRLGQRVRSMADAACARSAAALEASTAWVPDGASSAGAWIAWQCGTSRAVASASIKTGRALREMPGTATAFDAGDVTAEHVRLLAHALRTDPEAFAEGGEAELLACTGLLFSQLEKVVRYWCHLHDPDDADELAKRRYASRRAHCSRTFQGMFALDAFFESLGGAIFKRELDRLERELFEEDLAEARERMGDGVSLDQLRRTPAQRRADALVLMAERSAAKPAGAVEARVLLQVLVGNKGLEHLCELSNGDVITPGELIPHLDRADIERIVFDASSRPIDVGARQRLFMGAKRIAVKARDRICTHPSCDVPAERCEVDHIVRYTDGGPTLPDNGRCLCRYHHRRARPG